MDKILIFLLVAATAVSVFATYQLTMVRQDFEVVNIEGELEEDYDPESNAVESEKDVEVTDTPEDIDP